MPNQTTAKPELDEFRGNLLKSLAKIDRPGEFCVMGDCNFVLPGLDVQGIGPVGFPLTKTQAKQLIKRCRQAPYGKGTQTLVDKDVRRVWELDPSQFSLSNPEFHAAVSAILKESQQALGLGKQKLTPHLYKLLVYEEGSFFLPHRDGEKLDGMIATLVIGLPSPYTGGELVVSHDGQKSTARFDAAARGTAMSHALFYADCEHEVRKLKSGYRICLTYNVAMAKSRRKDVVSAPSYTDAIASLAERFAGWPDDTEAEKLAFTLDHAYTAGGLRIGLLKGVDRAKAEALFSAAELADCVAHLAIVTHWKSGSAEGDYEYDRYGWGGRRRRSYYDDENEDENDDNEGAGAISKYTMGEVYDESLVASDWSDTEGAPVLLGELDIDGDELVTSVPLSEWQASREEFEGYTGNAGMTLERWYHRAAVIVWPRSRHFDVLTGAGTAASIAGLQKLVKGLKSVAKASHHTALNDCLAFARSIIKSWKSTTNNYRWDRDSGTELKARNGFSKLLVELGNVDLIRSFLDAAMLADTKVGLDKSFLQFCKRHGWNLFRTELLKTTGAVSPDSIERNLGLLSLVSKAADASEERIALSQEMCDVFIAAFVKSDGASRPAYGRRHSIDRAKLLESFYCSAMAAENDTAIRLLLDHSLESPKNFDLTDHHLAAIFSLEKKLAKPVSANVVHWMNACRSELQNRTATVPQKPADYRRDSAMGCSCADCNVLSSFLKDPETKQVKLPLAKQRRQHLHGIIDSKRLDLTHVTERIGSPQRLVLTKTTASWEAARKIYERDRKNLSRLRKIISRLR